MGSLQPQPALARGEHVRIDWLLLAPVDLLPDPPGAESHQVVRFVGDSGIFKSALLADRPSLALLRLPPGSATDIDLVASERRRRTTLRAVLVNPRRAVTERLDALRLGFDEAFDDGIDRDELEARLILLVAQAGRGRTHELAVTSDVVLDTEARQLRVRGGPVHLRPKEFGLIQVLANHPGQTFTRRQLLDRAWGTDHGGDQRTIDVHIRWLREKVEEDPDQPRWLLTVRGVGYRLAPPER
ncbi:N/A [soil metagenome]